MSFVEAWLYTEQQHIKSNFVSWGRQVLRAIDFDDPAQLYEAFDSTDHLGANINEQTNALGYGGIVWTPYIHEFLGDTALHLALKAKKIECIHVLLILGANHSIKNDKGETAGDLSMKIFNRSIGNFTFEALRHTMRKVPADQYYRLPHNFNYKDVKKEAWELMESGRNMYTELPRSFTYEQNMIIDSISPNLHHHLSFNVEKKLAKGEEPPSSSTIFNEKCTSETKNDKFNHREFVTQAELDSRWQEIQELSEFCKQSKANNEEHFPLMCMAIDEVSHIKERAIQAKIAWEKEKDLEEKKIKEEEERLKKEEQHAAAAAAAGGGGSRPTSAVASNNGSRPSSAAAARKTNSRPSSAAAAAAAAVANIPSSRPSSAASTSAPAVAAAAAAAGPTTVMGRASGISSSSSSSSRPTSASTAALLAQQTKGGSKDKRGRIPLRIKAQLEAAQSSGTTTGSTAGGNEITDGQIDDDGNFIGCECQFEIAVLKAQYKERKALRRVQLQQRSILERKECGISSTPGAWATGDVWSRGAYSDVVAFVLRQKNRRITQRRLTQRNFVAEGASLATSVRLGDSPLKRVQEKEILLHDKSKYSSLVVPKDIGDLKGISKLKFVKIGQLSDVLNSVTNVPVIRSKNDGKFKAFSGTDKLLSDSHTNIAGDNAEVNTYLLNFRANDAPPVSTLPASSKNSAAAADAIAVTGAGTSANGFTGHTTNNIDIQGNSYSEDLKEGEGRGGGGATAEDYKAKEDAAFDRRADSYREITSLSTRHNMKYMRIGDEGLKAISNALVGDMIISELCFANARVSSVGVRDLAAAIGGDPDNFSVNAENQAMSALRVLDLSGNLICNDGAISLADALYGCLTLESISLAGNRIELKGALSITEAVLDTPRVTFLSLKNNFLSEEDLQTIAKMLDEQEYRDNSGKHAVTVPGMGPLDALSEKERERQIQVLKAGKRLKSMKKTAFRTLPNTSSLARCYYYSGRKHGGVFKWVGQELDSRQPKHHDSSHLHAHTRKDNPGTFSGARSDDAQQHYSIMGRVPEAVGMASNSVRIQTLQGVYPYNNSGSAAHKEGTESGEKKEEEEDAKSDYSSGSEAAVVKHLKIGAVENRPSDLAAGEVLLTHNVMAARKFIY